MDNKIQVLEFDFKTGKNKMKDTEKKPSAVPSVPPPSVTTNTRTWSSDPEWFDGYKAPKEEAFSAPLKFTHPHTENIMDIQEKNVADAYMNLMKAKREFLQEKRKLNKLYKSFNIEDIKI